MRRYFGRRRENAVKIKRGLRLGIQSPRSRVPVIRPRRDRIMGSSILASLSEAGGNDPSHSVNGPLPPHTRNSADRVERDRTQPYASALPNSRAIAFRGHAVFSMIYEFPLRRESAKSPESGIAVPQWNLRPDFGTVDCVRLVRSRTFNLSFALHCLHTRSAA